MRWLSFVVCFALVAALAVGSVGCKKGGTNNTTRTAAVNVLPGR
jgi:hypothetical protein